MNSRKIKGQTRDAKTIAGSGTITLRPSLLHPLCKVPVDEIGIHPVGRCCSLGHCDGHAAQR